MRRKWMAAITAASMLLAVTAQKETGYAMENSMTDFECIQIEEAAVQADAAFEDEVLEEGTLEETETKDAADETAASKESADSIVIESVEEVEEAETIVFADAEDDMTKETKLRAMNAPYTNSFLYPELNEDDFCPAVISMYADKELEVQLINYSPDISDYTVEWTLADNEDNILSLETENDEENDPHNLSNVLIPAELTSKGDVTLTLTRKSEGDTDGDGVSETVETAIKEFKIHLYPALNYLEKGWSELEEKIFCPDYSCPVEDSLHIYLSAYTPVDSGWDDNYFYPDNVESENPDVVTFTQSGEYWTMKTLKAGTANVKVTYTDAGVSHTDSITVTVKDHSWTGENPRTCSDCGAVETKNTENKTTTQNSQTEQKQTEQSLQEPSSFVISGLPRGEAIWSGKTLQLSLNQKITLTYMGASSGDSVVSWKSSNKKVMTVSQKGVVKAKTAGTAKLTVKFSSGRTETYTVKVPEKRLKTTKIKLNTGKTLKLKKGKKFTLSATLQPVASTDLLKFSSSNKKVASVTQKGVIKAKKKGKTKITVKAGSKKVSVTVAVK